MWNFERKWAKNNFLICRALLGNGVVWVCLQGGGDADWVSCWLSWLTMWLNQGIVRVGWWLGMFSLGLGVQWVGWLHFDLMVRGGCVTGWLGMGLSQSVCVVLAGCWLGQWIVCVCVCVCRGGVVDRIGLYWWWLGMCSLGLGVQWVGWLYFDSGGRWLGHWMVGEWGWVRVCVCGAGWVLVR